MSHLKLGLDDETTPDSLTHKDIGVPIGRGSMKTAYILKDHDFLILIIHGFRAIFVHLNIA
jgi:hypothetical protein